MKDAETWRYLPPMLFGIYRFYRQGRLATKKDAMVLLDSDHTKTARKYLELAESLGLVEIVQSKTDKRKSLLVPTDILIQAIRKDLSAVANETRWLLAYMIDFLLRGLRERS